MSKVFIVNKSNHDFSDAERFGQLHYITEGRVSRFNINDMVRKAKESLVDSKPDDKILTCSLTILNAMVCAVFAKMHGRLNILLYKNGIYIERNVIIEEEN